MKNTARIFLLFLFTTLLSCSNDDDNSVVDTPTTLSGTHWIRTTNSTRHFTFTSSTEYVYSEGGVQYPGTYTYSGSSGTFTETSSGSTISFKVNGNILSANQDDTNPDFEALYEKQ